jgi:threonine dehydratase
VGHYTFPVIRALVDEVVTVTDDELRATLRMMAERMKLVAEPTGALGVAAALHGKVAMAGLRVGIIVSGGNVDLARFGSLIGPDIALQ